MWQPRPKPQEDNNDESEPKLPNFLANTKGRLNYYSQILCHAFVILISGYNGFVFTLVYFPVQ